MNSRFVQILSILILNLFFASVIYGQNILNQQFKKYKTIKLDPTTMEQEMKNNKSFPYQIQLEGHNISLIPSNILSKDYKQMTSDGMYTPVEELATPYRGYTAKGERVSLTMGKDFIYGFINDGEKSYYIEPAIYYNSTATKNEYVIYEKGDVKSDAPKTCGVTAESKKLNTLEVPQKSVMVGECYEIDYAICNDYSMVLAKGSVSAAQNFAIGVTNDVNVLYDDEFDDELQFIITGQFTSNCSTCDPWSSTTNASSLLSSFRTWALSNLSIQHDVASLWTNRDFDGSTVGIAYVGTVCGSARYNCLQNFSSSASQLQVMVTHELGHNFNASHDTSSGFIMSPSVNNTTTWSSTSINTIENFYNSITCLAACEGGNNGGPLEVAFQNSFGSTNEFSTTGSTGSCGLNYVDYAVNVVLTSDPSSVVNVSVYVDGSSTAVNGYDYQIENYNLSFSPSGSLIKSINIKVLDDKVEEIDELLRLNLIVTSGDVDLGANNQFDLTISDGKDFVSESCCSGGGSVTYSNSNLVGVGIFHGHVQDAKTRTIILASELTAAGLTAGFINSMSLRIYQKTSNGVFNDFRIGLASVTNTTLTNMAWISTEQVFIDDVTTTVSWNDYEFDTPYYWDGTSNLYIQYCFNNSTAIGYDASYFTDPTSATGVMTQYQLANNTNGCNSGDIGGTASINGSVQPQLKFGQSGGAIVESAQGQSAKSYLLPGEIAHYYSNNEKVIATIENTGTSTINCTTVSTSTAGNNQITAGFGSGSYTQKTFNITGDSNAEYDITLFYTQNELSTWGGEIPNLNMVKSSVALNQASNSQVEIVTPIVFSNDVGGITQYGYTASFVGFGYFAMTNAVPEGEDFAIGEFENTDLVIDQFGRGVLLHNDNGVSYRLRVNSSGNPYVQNTTGTPAACLEVGQLSLSANKGIIIKRSANAYTRLYINNSGVLTRTNLSTLPSNRISLLSGDFEIQENGAGIILQNSNGNCYKVEVLTNGTLNTSPANCN